MSNYTYVTYLGSDNYLIGVLALNYQLKKYKCKYPLTVLITHNLNENTLNILHDNKIETIPIKSIDIPLQIIANNKKRGMSNWNKTFEKLKLFSLIKFKKIVYLDADMLVLGNLDSLFKEKHLSAVISGTKYPGNEDWSQTLNSGLMVIVPKKNEDHRLISLIGKGNLQSGGGDQGIIHAAYPTWPEEKNLHLCEAYNLLAPYESYYLAKGLINYPDLKIVHYIGPIKPWQLRAWGKSKHIVHELYKGIMINHSIRGIRETIQDFIYYCKLCRKIKIKYLYSEDNDN